MTVSTIKKNYNIFSPKKFLASCTPAWDPADEVGGAIQHAKKR